MHDQQWVELVEPGRWRSRNYTKWNQSVGDAEHHVGRACPPLNVKPSRLVGEVVYHTMRSAVYMRRSRDRQLHNYVHLHRRHDQRYARHKSDSKHSIAIRSLQRCLSAWEKQIWRFSWLRRLWSGQSVRILAQKQQWAARRPRQENC